MMLWRDSQGEGSSPAKSQFPGVTSLASQVGERECSAYLSVTWSQAWVLRCKGACGLQSMTLLSQASFSK